MVKAAAIINKDAAVQRQAHVMFSWIAKLCVLQVCLFRIYLHYTAESRAQAKLLF